MQEIRVIHIPLGDFMVFPEWFMGKCWYKNTEKVNNYLEELSTF